MASKISAPQAAKAKMLPALATAATILLSFSAPTSAATANTLALVGRTAADKPITVALFLPSRDPKGAADFVAHVSKPGDAQYRKYLTTSEYTARFGASRADYDAVVAWAQSKGLTVGERYAARHVIPVTGTAIALEAALGITFNDYRDQKGRVFYAAAGTTLPAEIAGKVASVIGLSSQAHFVPQLKILPSGSHSLGAGTGNGGAFTALDLRTLYSVPAQTFGPQQTLAVFEQGGFTQSDVTTYLIRNNLPAVPTTLRGVNGYGGGVDNADIEVEAVLDIDMQIALNPAAKQILVYEDGTDAFPVALLDGLSAMADDNKAKSISISYGLDETLQGADSMNAEAAVLTQMAAQGQAVFASTGDNGAYGDESLILNVSDPASQPLVTAVGGSTLFAGAKQAYQVEEVWNDLAAGTGATGGGVSVMWPIPGYQLTNGTPLTTANGGSATMRNVPDVAAVANPLTGVEVYSKLRGGWLTIGGTSASAPIWAGYYSLIGAAAEGLGFGNPGFANPAIYLLGWGGGHLIPDFNDIQDGSNGYSNPQSTPGFYAGYLYDNTTGWGSFAGSNLVIDMAILPNFANPNPPPTPTGITAIATPTSITLKWNGKGDNGFVILGFNYQTNALVAANLVKVHTTKLTGLKPNTTYNTEVVAITSGGTTVSAPFIITTPKTGG